MRQVGAHMRGPTETSLAAIAMPFWLALGFVPGELVALVAVLVNPTFEWFQVMM